MSNSGKRPGSRRWPKPGFRRNGEEHRRRGLVFCLPFACFLSALFGSLRFLFGVPICLWLRCSVLLFLKISAACANFLCVRTMALPHLTYLTFLTHLTPIAALPRCVHSC